MSKTPGVLCAEALDEFARVVYDTVCGRCLQRGPCECDTFRLGVEGMDE